MKIVHYQMNVVPSEGILGYHRLDKTLGPSLDTSDAVCSEIYETCFWKALLQVFGSTRVLGA